ncbi:hypothetical protein C7402_102280 [Paraburkholderia unamae]|uniref:Uncharacterized protein n=1 Tax=Paraburkholderia unamae TaxID=219649 RepID=A0ABX5KZ60_9BURK|nr:hypothetical protein C7402_102280 [Paraburkholderia unamae]
MCVKAKPKKESDVRQPACEVAGQLFSNHFNLSNRGKFCALFVRCALANRNTPNVSPAAASRRFANGARPLFHIRVTGLCDMHESRGRAARNWRSSGAGWLALSGRQHTACGSMQVDAQWSQDGRAGGGGVCAECGRAMQNYSGWCGCEIPHSWVEQLPLAVMDSSDMRFKSVTRHAIPRLLWRRGQPAGSHRIPR